MAGALRFLTFVLSLIEIGNAFNVCPIRIITCTKVLAIQKIWPDAPKDLCPIILQAFASPLAHKIVYKYLLISRSVDLVRLHINYTMGAASNIPKLLALLPKPTNAARQVSWMKIIVMDWRC